MNRGNCRKTTSIPEKEWCVINNENNKIIAGYVHKSSAQKKAKEFDVLGENLVRIELLDYRR